MIFADYYQKFSNIVKTMEDKKAVPAFERITDKASEWTSNVTAGSKEAVKAGKDTFLPTFLC